MFPKEIYTIPEFVEYVVEESGGDSKGKLQD